MKLKYINLFTSKHLSITTRCPKLASVVALPLLKLFSTNMPFYHPSFLRTSSLKRVAVEKSFYNCCIPLVVTI